MTRSTEATRVRILQLGALLGAAGILSGIVLACSSDENGSSGSTKSSATGTGATGGTNFSASGGSGGANNGAGGTAGFGGACASDTFDAALIPLDIYLVFDRSYSMNVPADMSSTRWQAVTTAIKAFVQSSPADTSVGLQYFPLFQAAITACTTDADCPGTCAGCCLPGQGGGHCLPEPAYECSAAVYSNPDVPIAALPGNEAAIVGSLDAHFPYGGTPTAPALQGGLDYAKTWAGANPTHKTVVVLATDGYPTTCDPIGIMEIAAIASVAATGTPAISTFVVGVGDGLDNLNAIAIAGGTTQAFVVTDQNASKEFAAALDAIRKSLACEFTIPTPTTGEPDYGKINVQYTPGGGMATILGQVANLDACTDAGGWYYDDPANPKIIKLCPASCSVAKADPNGKVDILLGCKTVIAPPK